MAIRLTRLPHNHIWQAADMSAVRFAATWGCEACKQIRRRVMESNRLWR
jgi:hypothetical protein